MSVSYWGGASVEVAIAFGKGAADAVVDGDFTDVSAYVRGEIQIQRGRSSELDTFQTGTASVTLSNRDRRFDPEYSAGPYFGNLLPNRHIRIRLTYAGSTSYLFKGYVSGWPQTWPLEAADRDSVVTLQCHDWMKLAARCLLPTDAYKPEVLADTPAAYYRLGEPAGDALMLDSSGNNRHATYIRQSIANYQSLANAATPTGGLLSFASDGARSTVYADTSAQTIFHEPLPYLLTGTAWTAEVWARVPAALIEGGSLTAVIFRQVQYNALPTYGCDITVSWDGASTLEIVTRVTDSAIDYAQWQVAVTRDFLDRAHHYVVTYNAGTAKFYLDGVDQGAADFTSGTLSGTDWGNAAFLGGWFNFLPNLVVDEFAMYASALSSTRVAAHYDAGSGVYAGETVDERMTRALDLTPYAAYPTSFASSTQTVRGFEPDGGALLDYLRAMERAEGGQARLFVAADGTLTFHGRYHATLNATVDTAYTDASGTTYPYHAVEPEYDDTRVINYATVSRVNGDPQVAQDATSQTAYGVVGASIDALQIQSDAECLDRANALVYAYKQPAQRVRSLTIVPRRNPSTLYPKIRTTEIGTRISVRRSPLGVGSAYTKELTVEGITHAFDVLGNWRTTFLTGSVDTADDWLVLDSSTQGIVGTNRIGF